MWFFKEVFICVKVNIDSCLRLYSLDPPEVDNIPCRTDQGDTRLRAHCFGKGVLNQKLVAGGICRTRQRRGRTALRPERDRRDREPERG